MFPQIYFAPAYFAPTYYLVIHQIPAIIDFSVMNTYALDPFGFKSTPPAFKQVLGSSQLWVITACYAGRPKANTFTADDVLDAKVYTGDGQATLFAPPVGWQDANQGTINLVVTAAQLAAAGITPGEYRLEVGVTPQSDPNRHAVAYTAIRFVGTSGTESLPASLVSWPDVLNYSSDVAKLEHLDVDQTQFAGQRAHAMNLFVQEVVRRYSPRPGGARRYASADGTTSGPYLRYAPSPDGLPPPTREQLKAWLVDPTRLRVNEDVLEANARLAASLVYGSSPGSNNPYQQMADKERALAYRALGRAQIDVDTKDVPDGIPTVRFDRDVTYLT